MIHLTYRVRGKLCRFPGPPEKGTKWVQEQIKPETKLKLSCMEHIMRRQRSLEKTVMLVKIEGNRERKKSNMRWIASTKEVKGMSPQ